MLMSALLVPTAESVTLDDTSSPKESRMRHLHSIRWFTSWTPLTALTRPSLSKQAVPPNPARDITGEMNPTCHVNSENMLQVSPQSSCCTVCSHADLTMHWYPHIDKPGVKKSHLAPTLRAEHHRVSGQPRGIFRFDHEVRKETLFTVRVMEHWQDDQKGYGVSILGRHSKAYDHGPGQPDLGDSAWATE